MGAEIKLSALLDLVFEKAQELIRYGHTVHGGLLILHPTDADWVGDLEEILTPWGNLYVIFKESQTPGEWTIEPSARFQRR